MTCRPSDLKALRENAALKADRRTELRRRVFELAQELPLSRIGARLGVSYTTVSRLYREELVERAQG